MSEENVKVAVRVRPFNSREKNLNSRLIIAMRGSNTYIINPQNGEEKIFAFDHSYWSHDGFEEDKKGYFSPSPGNVKFADQKRVYDDLGAGILNNAWQGYNSTLFAYGQTGSGKSWSIVGYGSNKGIVPTFAEQMFKGIEKEKNKGTAKQFEVKFSMLEIYSEKVRDLLNAKTNKRSGLKVRQHPKKGFYAEGLTTAFVDSYKAIETQMEEGTHNRTVAATNMNATSSRAHTIVGITFIQKSKNAAGEETAKSSVINLVDLAGSERADSTGATGDRLKEGAAINQSLSALGNVIAALADSSTGKHVKVPFRDSVLTKLLKNALGGNSKTIMAFAFEVLAVFARKFNQLDGAVMPGTQIAAISPASVNYEESLSTLRYADRAKQIKTVAIVNEDPTDKLIRELREENDKLMLMLQKGQVPRDRGDVDETAGMTEEEIAELKKQIEDEMRAEMEENEREMEEMRKSYEEKLKQAQETQSSLLGGQSKTNNEKKTKPHLYNLNMDPQLTGMITHILQAGVNTIGKKKSDITLLGPSIMDQHAKVICKQQNGKVGSFLLEKLDSDARIFVNGEPVTAEPEELHHFDRIMFGTTQLFVFANPAEKNALKKKWIAPDYEMAQKEISQTQHDGLQQDTQSDYLLQQDLIELTPAVEEANSISEELDKKVKFDIVLVSPQARGQLTGATEVYVKMRNLETGLEWMWPRQKFINRKYVMQEMFEDFQDGEKWEVPDEKDPFTESADTEVHIGSTIVLLESLSYMIEMTEQLEITNYKGLEIGKLNIELMPCAKDGHEYTETDNFFVDEPAELIGTKIHFKIKIISARGLPSRYTDMRVKYLMYLDENYHESAIVPNTSNPDFNFAMQFDFDFATKQLVEYLRTGCIMVQIWGKQKATSQSPKRLKNTKHIMKSERLALASARPHEPGVKGVDMDKMKTLMQLHVANKKNERCEERLAQLRNLLDVAEQTNHTTVPLDVVRLIISAQTAGSAEAAIQLMKTANKKEQNAKGGQKADKSDDKGCFQKSSICTLV